MPQRTVARTGAKLLVLPLALLFFAPAPTHPQAAPLRVAVRYQNPIINQRYPELVYWFLTPETLPPQHYTRDIQHIAHETKFDFPFLTPRMGVNLFDSPATHQAVAGIARLAHQNGLRLGAQFPLQEVDSLRNFPLADEQTVVADAEATLDARGHAELDSSIKLRSAPALKTALLRVYVFRKTGPGEYDPATLEDVTTRATSAAPVAGTIHIALDLGPQYAGFTAFAMANTWFKALDLFSDAYAGWVREAINQYRDVPLDGTALDEFGYVRIPMNPNPAWRGQFAGQAFATHFRQTTGRELTRTLFDSRYAPAGHPEVRIGAINIYWDFLRSGPLRVEREFYQYSRQVFGPKTFAGIHDTFHNHLTNDEAWATGINWWKIPRQYGMSDEDLSLPLRMGLLVSHPGNIMYDQFYGFNIQRFAVKALRDARFDGRLHYHGYNDTGRWGADLSTQPFLSSQNPVEQKIRLLNRFNPAAPQLPLLVVFGMPALLNWYPDAAARNDFDINGSLRIEEKVMAVWVAGYRCAVVPSDLIDSGALHLDAQNRPVLNGHTFRAIIYLAPQYARQSTLTFLDAYTRHGGALMLDGTATRDFNGNLISSAFDQIAARARVKHFSIDSIPQLGVEKSPLRGIGGTLEDGSVILTDVNSLETGMPRSFVANVNGHQFAGSYIGVLALQARTDGTLQKLACGVCGPISRDGRMIFSLRNPADVVLTRTPAGAYQAVVQGTDGSNALTLAP